MSCIYRGSVIESELSSRANGGTEQMRARVLRNVRGEYLEKVAIHLSRPRSIYDDVSNIMYCHDTATDPENKILLNGGWKRFDFFVFVSYWQRDQYVLLYNIPYSKCTVIENAIELESAPTKEKTEMINFIYHTTPHRGLEILFPVFDILTREYQNIHLDVFSSFKIYGWEQRDARYQSLFDKLQEHRNITYHGTKSNQTVLEYLKKAHIFAYPSIWQETSCISLIEAMHAGCLCIHPNLGALPETAGDSTVMYDYHEDVNKHASVFYANIKKILETNNFNSNATIQPKHTIQKFKSNWEKLLERILHER